MSNLSTGPERKNWPKPLEDVAFHGLGGEIVQAIEPHTEADPAALLLQMLVGFGTAVGRSPHCRVEADRHGTNLWCALVGTTSKGRKGTSWGHIKQVLSAADETFGARLTNGLSTGEGLIWNLRDRSEMDRPEAGGTDKRLLAVEPEFASVLRASSRDGNTLSAVLRSAWDTGDMRTMTKNCPAICTGTHVGIVVHCTQDELLRYLTATESANGFANRFLWAVCKRARVLPDGGHLQAADLEHLTLRLRNAISFAKGVAQLCRSASAGRLWHEVYEDLSEARPGLFGAITARAEAQVLRLSATYALLDQSEAIELVHLEAALAVWAYCERSAAFVFGNKVGDPVADAILAALRESPAGLTRTEIRDLFRRNQTKLAIERALATLREAGAICLATTETTQVGRRIERWTATTRTTKTTGRAVGRHGRLCRSEDDGNGYL
jgi:hypothetical protein